MMRSEANVPLPAQILSRKWFRSDDVVALSRLLLGKLLATECNGKRTVGRIVETEAYAGVNDRASHAFGGRRTARTEVFYEAGGVAYVYLCYGIHQMFNIITGPENVPHAILIRGVEPLEGIDIMRKRMNNQRMPEPQLGRGPGNVGRAFGFHRPQTGLPVTGPEIQLLDDGFVPAAIRESPRIGVAYAGDDALLPYRFYLPGNPSVSGSKALRT